ncbi:NAD(P)H-hydrate epimerase [Fertoebacter nigrum]|uniref:Bifunctional NAD(P)H-hydrate repair enzyme n=1 Tax=Fertoeibacter niger TaxID=2656921 RepID=A0A8X8GRD1_9RHOB|nr:NAD(P)H-hydrate epimerase [Fertoeibacter niger]NUB42939.1 NAD(P)H-hydrate epimerase [Fertoeibacter niger]
MTELLTSAQMRGIEAAAMASGAVTGLDLMERAGQGVVDALLAMWPDLASGVPRVAVLCGPGNNGGDGFVVARLLRERGWQVEVFAHGAPDRLPPDARANHDRWLALGPVAPLGDLCGGFGKAHVDLVVDAVFGTGLTRALDWDVEQPLADISEWRLKPWRQGHTRIVAVDVPSGLCADSGRDLGLRLAADLTVTFHRAKPGQYLAEGPDHCGRLVVADIGLPPAAPRSSQPGEVTLVDARAPRSALKWGGQKYDHGHVLVLAGGVGQGGAARMAARGALRMGAGLVTLGCPPAALIENAAQLNAIMLRRVDDPAALTALLEDRRINALCLGPGLGVERAAGLLPAALAARREQAAVFWPGLVLDADALTALAADPALMALLHRNCVLTPHRGEFARLFPDLIERLHAEPKGGPVFSKADATREAARRAGCVVLFKGADTVIADPEGRCSIHAAAYDRPAPWLATAGAGDVLAGFIAGLLARRNPAVRAAESAAWLHVDCARSFGPGLIAEDLPEELPKVFRALGW